MENITEQIIDDECKKAYQDFLKPKELLRKRKSKIILLVFFVCCFLGGLLGGSCMKFFNQESGSQGISNLDFIAGIMCFIVCSFLHIFIHELGHLVFGLLSGYKFLSFRIFSFTIVKKDGKTLKRKIKVPGTVGQCLMYPPEWNDDKPFPYVLYNLGGGMFNLIFSALVIPLLFTSSQVLKVIAILFIISGLLLGLSNLIPLIISIPNDGMNCLMCKKAKGLRKAFYLQLKLNGDLSNGISLASVPKTLFELDETLDLSNMLVGSIKIMEFYWHLANQDFQTAKQCLYSLIPHQEKMPQYLLNFLDLERMYILLQEKASLPELASYYKFIGPVFKEKTTDLGIIRIKYAYAALLSEEERKTIEMLSRMNKTKLPKKLKGYKPLSVNAIYEEAKKAYVVHPVIGEAQVHMDLINQIKSSLEK